MTGALLINLGTPADPSPGAVGTYLREFLMDPLVIDIPYLFRWFLVNVAIVPRRAAASAKLYQKIWTDRGSPLLYHSMDLAKRVQGILGDEFPVELGMRYGSPSIETAIKKLRERGAKNLVALPLYPQYSLAATESSIAKVCEFEDKVEFVPPFYSEEAYLDAVEAISREPLRAAHADRVLFSFHGLPQRHIKKTDFSGGTHCVFDSKCCAAISESNQHCYRAQCFATARSLAKRLGIPDDQYDVCFQSRLNDRWIQPFTDSYYRELPKQGVKRLAVISPSFVADCLETVEEVGIRGQAEFREHGGEEVTLIPSLNSEEIWAQAVAKILRNHQPA